ncbi:hypothetical protein QBC35DRAFT_488856 [Podospora australis]|uniref:Uncharacterized protein n=1 Tax=Podospora australis TaxID=1536484 RepID=A0AAN6WYR0_9PEZI|nr:hypothetical protein QBC35DRAFT_488856 [Podospora australis]
MVAILYFRLYCKKEEEEDKVIADSSSSNEMEETVDEKRVVGATPKSRSCSNWPFASLTAARACQLFYFAFLHFSIFVFDGSGYFRGEWAWYYNPEDEALSRSSMRWARALSLMNLVYHLTAFILLIVLRKKEIRKWRVFGITTMFGDLLAMWSVLHVLRLLHRSYTNYCYDVPRTFDYERHGVMGYLGKGQFNPERYFSCGLLDGIYTVGVIPALSHLLTILATAINIDRRTQAPSRSQESESEVFPKIRDLEQGPTILSARPSTQLIRPANRHESAVSSREASPSPSRPSPPPSYRSRSGSNETQSTRPPSYREAPPRLSVETTSTIDPDLYLVSDGWRGPEQQPPDYSSRPPSLRGQQK